MEDVKTFEKWSDYESGLPSNGNEIEFKSIINMKELRDFVWVDPSLSYGGNPDVSDVLDSVEKYLRSKIIK